MRWCEGVAETAERPLTEGERAALARLRRRLAWRIAGWLALAVASPLAAAAAIALAVRGGPAHPEALRTVGAVAFLAGVLLGPAAALLRAHDLQRERRRLRRDAAAGIAVEFGAGALAVVPASGRIVARGGRSADLRARVRLGDAAPLPAATPTYALAGALAGDADARELSSLGLVRRPLSREERDELRGHARGLRRVPRSLWLVGAWWALAALRGVARTGPRRRELVLVVTLPLALGAWRLLRARALAARLEADAEEGWAIRATAGATSGDEALPASRAAWTARGAPAPWRLGAGR
jgi:hypothetical protein